MGLRAPKIRFDETEDPRTGSDEATALEERDVLDTLETEYAEPGDGDSPVRGIVNGVAAGAALWAIAIAAYLLVR
jgi:hypothetical protein